MDLKEKLLVTSSAPSHLGTGQKKAALLDGKHIYELTERQVAGIFDRPIYQDVIGSHAFQRLKKIHFLGSLDYVVDPKGPKPNKRHTRYQHSIGVARLALQFSRDRDLSKSEEEVAVVSALLHDIGHAPLSHSLERVFDAHFGVNHHKISEAIVRGDVPIGRGLSRVLSGGGVNSFEVLATLSGKSDKKFRELFNHCINIDTIEAISRSITYIQTTSLNYAPSTFLFALMTMDQESARVLDSFWLMKDAVYNNLIGSRFGVLADYVCAEYMRRNIDSFRADNYYLTEIELRAQHPRLFALLENLSETAVSSFFGGVTSIDYVKRRFFVDMSVELDSVFSLQRRYKQKKVFDSIQISHNNEKGEGHVKRQHSGAGGLLF